MMFSSQMSFPNNIPETSASRISRCGGHVFGDFFVVSDKLLFFPVCFSLPTSCILSVSELLGIHDTGCFMLQQLELSTSAEEYPVSSTLLGWKTAIPFWAGARTDADNYTKCYKLSGPGCLKADLNANTRLKINQVFISCNKMFFKS